MSVERPNPERGKSFVSRIADRLREPAVITALVAIAIGAAVLL